MQVPYEHGIFISDPDDLPSRIIISILQNRKLRPQAPHSQQCPTISFPQQSWASGCCQDRGDLWVFTPSLSLQTSKDQKQGSWSLLGASGGLESRMWLPPWEVLQLQTWPSCKNKSDTQKISPNFGLGASGNPDWLFPWFLALCSYHPRQTYSSYGFRCACLARSTRSKKSL